MSGKKNCGHSIDLICGCVPIQSTEDRTVELFLGALNPFSASGPFQILKKRGTEIRTVNDEEEPRVSLIYEEWNE